ncbi:reverse transcriptase [Lasius niger]|uniref:Reverse transcriptase n=1 Tax=Lasius niger TaxID=67767 RepID=A0A0J7K960_LASNI|nr:reverse transcriptase [Lasius niger]
MQCLPSCVIEVKPEVRKVLLERGRIFLRYAACALADHVRIVQCFKCLSFGHYAANCKGKPSCGHCTGEHEMKDCRSRDSKPRVKDMEDIKICHVNCQSLIAHLDKFRHFFLKTCYHIICMSETWMRPGVSDALVGLPGYSLFRCDRGTRQGGGVGFFLLDSLRASVLCSSEGSVAGRPEYIIAEIESSDSAKLLIAVVYRPPNVGYLGEFFQKFSEYQSADTKLCLHPGNATGTVQIYASLEKFKYSDLSIIDDRDKLMEYGQQDVAFLSAHDLIYVKYRIKTQRRCGRRITYRDWSCLDMDAFMSDICGIDWTVLLASNNMDEKVEEFNTKLIEILNKQVPLRTRCFKNLPAPWLTEDIRRVMRSRDQARRAWRRYRCDRLYNRYKALRNNVQALVRDAKKEHYMRMFSRAGKAEEIWRGLRHLGLIKARAEGGRLRHTVEELSEFFAQSAEQLEQGDGIVLEESAYRSHHSAQTCLVRMLDDVRKAANCRMVTVSVFFDFSKAFDRVNHLRLIEKLKRLNFSDSILRWVHSYLTDRTQVVKDKSINALSAGTLVKVGVPQGSVLGPLLFMMYLSDFESVLNYCKYNFYVDDLQVYLHCEPRNLRDAIWKMNKDIEAIIGWTTTNGLLLNANKTQAIILGTSRYINSVDLRTLQGIEVDKTMIEFATEIKYLGVTITNTLSWERQVTSIAKKVHTTLYQLKLCKSLLPEELRARLVATLIQPHLEYCCVAYTDMTAEQDRRLYRALNACIRISAIRMWNGLPAEIRNEESQTAFKQGLYAHLLRMPD